MPSTLMRLSELRGILLRYATEGEEQARISANDIEFAENSLKGNKGRFLALTDAAAFAAREKQEQELRAAIAKDPSKQKLYGGAWDAIAGAQQARRALRVPYGYLETNLGFDTDLYEKAKTLVRASAELGKPNGERLREFRDSALPSLKQRLFSAAPIHKDLEKATLSWSLMKMREEMGPDDPMVKTVLGDRSPSQRASELVDGT